MLLKSTGSFRRKRAENSPVWREENKVEKTGMIKHQPYIWYEYI